MIVLISKVSEINNTTYVLTEFDPLQLRWYWISVFDVYGYSTVGSWYYVLDDNPTPVELDSITYQDGSFIISWSQNNDDDFLSYLLIESFSEDMSNGILIFTINDNAITNYTFNIDDGEYRYYQLIVENSNF